IERCGVEVRALIRKWGRAHVATRTIPCKQCRIGGKQSMNYLQYAFYAINIYLEKVIEDFRWGNTRARQSGNLAARAQIWCVGDTGSAKGCNIDICIDISFTTLLVLCILFHFLEHPWLLLVICNTSCH